MSEVTDTDVQMFEEKAKDLDNYFKVDEAGADKYVRDTINWLYSNLTGLMKDVSDMIVVVNKARVEGAGVGTKIKVAKQADSMAKEIGKKYRPFFDKYNAMKPDILAAIMRTVKDEYQDELAKIITLLIISIDNMAISP